MKAGFMFEDMDNSMTETLLSMPTTGNLFEARVDTYWCKDTVLVALMCHILRESIFL